VRRSLSIAGLRARVTRTAAAVVVIVGYVDLVRGGIVIAPLALVAGYLVLVPLSFLAE
jgi:hypothetical protein